MITPGTIVVTPSSRTGMMNEWSTSLVPSFVVPVASKFAAAICEPLVGQREHAGEAARPHGADRRR